jgi:hypothetical protein
MRPVTVICTITFFCFSLAVGAVESHCTIDEAIIFNCITGKKIVSVCASKTISPTAGYLQYRFGPKGSPDLVYPEDKVHPGPDVQSKTLTFAGGGGAFIRFIRGQYGYVVYTALGRGWGEKAGVAVEKDNKLMVNLPCKGAVQSEVGPDFFEKAGLTEDQTGFELP